MWKQIRRYCCILLIVIVSGCSLRKVNETTEIADSQSITDSTISDNSLQDEKSIKTLDNIETLQNKTWSFSKYDECSWLPNGEFLACFFDTEIDLYNTDNELVRHIELPKGISIKDYYLLACNSYFLLYPNKEYEDESGHSIIWIDKESNYLLSDMLQIDWEGNVIYECPKVQEKIGNIGVKRYYLEGNEVAPVEGSLSWSECIKRLNDNAIIFILSRDNFVNELYYYIPNGNSLNLIGEHDINNKIVITPLGMMRQDHRYLYLTTKDRTTTLFSEREVQYFNATDKLLIVVFNDEIDNEIRANGHPIYYASFDDMELNKIDNAFTDSYPTSINACGEYIVYRDYEENQGKGYSVYNSSNGESWFAGINGWSLQLRGIRLTDNGAEIIVYLKEGNQDHPKGYYVLSKEKYLYYPSPAVDPFSLPGLLNPQYSYYIDVSEDYNTFSIKPFCRD